MTLRGLPVTVRWLFSCFLITVGLGYVLAITYLFLLDVEPHGKMRMNLVQATIIKYYGNRGNTRLEVALNGSMADKISPAEKADIIGWIRNGAAAADYETVQPLFAKNCVSCHSAESGYPIPPLTSYQEVTTVAEVDLGQSVRALARVSHVHLFGMSFVFLLTGLIFALTEINKRLRLVIVLLPFIAIWLDIGSWWVTKYEPVFAYTVIIGGILMGLALAAQILISLWEMWLTRVGDGHEA
ncbi:MAG: hypothetical protein AB1451_00995 [Nitrospirota bacterium]